MLKLDQVIEGDCVARMNALPEGCADLIFAGAEKAVFRVGLRPRRERGGDTGLLFVVVEAAQRGLIVALGSARISGRGRLGQRVLEHLGRIGVIVRRAEALGLLDENDVAALAAAHLDPLGANLLVIDHVLRAATLTDEAHVEYRPGGHAF